MSCQIGLFVLPEFSGNKSIPGNFQRVLYIAPGSTKQLKCILFVSIYINFLVQYLTAL